MTVPVESVFDCSPPAVWREVQQSALLLEVIKPLARVSPAGSVAFPRTWMEGGIVQCKTYFLGFIPLGTRTIRFERIDQSAREIQTRERDASIAGITLSVSA